MTVQSIYIAIVSLRHFQGVVTQELSDSVVDFYYKYLPGSGDGGHKQVFKVSRQYLKKGIDIK
jgi:hypothetical protein